jgi:C-terminal processing protease CtpA/Prc
VLYTVRDARGRDLETCVAHPATNFTFILVVLEDEKTVQAAALLAALLNDCPRVMLIGTALPGAIAQRTTIPLADGQRLRLATRQIVLPRQSVTGNQAIVPALETTGSEWAAPTQPAPPMNTGGKPLSNEALEDKRLMERIGNDAALRRAVDLLLGLKALGVNTRDGSAHSTP